MRGLASALPGALGAALVLAWLPAALLAQDGQDDAADQAQAETRDDSAGSDRPEAGPGCVSLELAAARQTFPPDRIALYSEAGGWLGDVVLAPACPPVVARAHIYVADKNKQWGKICARDGPVNTHLWIQDTRCAVAGVVDARRFQGDPPDPIAPELERLEPRNGQDNGQDDGQEDGQANGADAQ